MVSDPTLINNMEGVGKYSYNLLKGSGEDGSTSTDETFGINFDISDSTNANTDNHNHNRRFHFSRVMLAV